MSSMFGHGGENFLYYKAEKMKKKKLTSPVRNAYTDIHDM
jgi:hypothetical protein